MNSTDPRHCPQCEGLGKKLLSATSIIFKGSGFYTTDYRDSGYVEAQKRDSTSPASKSAPAATTPASPAASEPASSTPTTPAATAPATPPATAPAKPAGTPSPASAA